MIPKYPQSTRSSALTEHDAAKRVTAKPKRRANFNMVRREVRYYKKGGSITFKECFVKFSYVVRKNKNSEFDGFRSVIPVVY